jgi:hypothetical protein
MKLFNKKLNLSSDDVLACEDYAQLKYWYSCVEIDILEMELRLKGEDNDRVYQAMSLQKSLSKLIQLQISKVGKPVRFEKYVIDVCKELFVDKWDVIIERARAKKELEEL